MKLNEKLELIQKEMAQTVPVDILNAFGQSLHELIELNLENHALKVGDIAPDFTLPDAEGLPISLYDTLQHNPVILSFFRGNWCPFCMAELAHYQEAINNNLIDSATVIAISPQTIHFNHDVTVRNNLEFRILSDKGNEIADKYGLVFTLQENVRDIYKNMGADLELFNNDKTYKLPIPATYLIDKNKKIIFSSVSTNYMERADVCDIKL
ncbi:MULTISPECIES: peroxiredoxin family protein [Gilliamella]|uniref:thioredoxin-dependent peroxiredoxin n=1 Tax=Gilliamella bombicola TaxID=1798182 RepID=A0A1C3ZB07_9GAMM|nr:MULTISPECIES: peroxiredoxin family protein [Gilliamella]SCB79541.1 Peroxiredoxin [Gilliamella bombicola]